MSEHNEGVFSDILDASEQNQRLLQEQAFERLEKLTPVQLYKSIKEHSLAHSGKSPSEIKDSLQFNQDIHLSQKNTETLWIFPRKDLSLWSLPVARHIFFNNMENIQDYIDKKNIVQYMINSFHPNNKHFAHLDHFLNMMDEQTAIEFHKDKVQNYSNYPLYMLDYFYVKHDEILATFFIEKVQEAQDKFATSKSVVSMIEDYALANFNNEKHTFKVSQDCLNILLDKCEELKVLFNLNKNTPKP